MPLANDSAAVIVQKWAQDLIRNTYHDDLLYLARDLPNAVSLKVSMTTMNDPDVISRIYDYPDIAIEQLRLAAMEFLRDVALDPDGVEKLRVEITDVSDTELLRIRDLAELGYNIQIMTRHVARNGDRLEITSTLSESRMTVNGMRHIPTIVKYQGILEHLDTHPEEYDAYFNHKNELSPEDNEWMRIDPSQGDRFDDSKYR